MAVREKKDIPEEYVVKMVNELVKVDCEIVAIYPVKGYTHGGVLSMDTYTILYKEPLN